MRPIAGKLRPHMRRDRNHPTNLPAGAVYRALRSGCDMARPRIDKRAYFYRAMTKADVRKFAVGLHRNRSEVLSASWRMSGSHEIGHER